jgi:hypothetical protein
VAIAPEPPPPVMVIIGACVYPIPACVNRIRSNELIPPLLVVIATAVASTDPTVFGAVEIATVGTDE